jgi:F-box and WD-40 domain protein 1/11
VNAIQIGNDEIVSASGDRLIKVWDIHNGRCMRTLMGHSKGIACVQIDKRRIVSGSNDDTVRIYDHASGAEVACLHGHQDLVRTVQAGFGDLPDADETLRQEAREVDNRYWEAQRRASLENDDDDDEDEDADNAAASQDAGANRQSEIRAVGAQIPPGGGGSKWARIVSGSYDETIIIWRRDQEGKWVPAQRLRQEDAARAASAMAVPQAAGSSSRNPDQAQAALAAQISATILPPHPNNQATGTHYGSQIPTATAPAPPATAPNLTLAALPQAAGTQLPPAAAILPTQPLNIPQAPIPANLAPTAQAAPNPQTGPAIPVPGPFPAPPAHHPYRGTHTSHPIARVFKLQFDARKLICASQDSRIVGWDFACADKEIEQACQFFTGF